MHYLRNHLPEVTEKLRAAPSCLLLLDFDGTLSPLAKTPAEAFLPAETKIILKKMNRRIPVAIISGRSLADIKRKVGIFGLAYVGNHGWEWEIGQRRGHRNVPPTMAKSLDQARRQLRRLAADYPGALLEDKGSTLSLHYRRLNPRATRACLRSARRHIAVARNQKLLTITTGKKVLELRPDLPWNKGHAAQLVRQTCAEDALPIYLGDDATDEDAFEALRDGVTVKIGRGHRSRAKYFLRDERQARWFLRWLCTELPRQPYSRLSGAKMDNRLRV